MSKVRRTHLLLLSFFILLIAGCQKTVSIDIGQIKPRLVVNSILDKDSLIRVQLSKSRTMTDSTLYIERINVATIKIFEDGILKQTLTKGLNGLFNSTMKPRIGSGYRIEIEDTGFGHIEASALIPPAPHLVYAAQTLDLTPGATTQYNKFKIGLSDDGIQPNFYYLRAFLIKKPYMPGANPVYVTKCNIYSDDNIVVTDDHTLKGVVFDGAAFVGSSYELIVYTPTKITTNYYLWLELCNISRDYYKYLVSGIMQNNAGNNPFAEPVIIKSNIQNGTGIFGAKNSVFIKATTF
jgi:hypothetical protein